MIAAERHLREVHSKGAVQSGSQELLNLLRGTIPAVPPPEYIEEDDGRSEITVAQAAKQLNVSERSVYHAAKVIHERVFT